MNNRYIFLLFCSLICGCAIQSDDFALARVGQVEIRASHLEAFENRLSGDRRTKKPGVEGYLDYLQTLIDKEVLLQEARKRGLADQPALRRKIKSERDMRAVKNFLRRVIHASITLGDEELRQLQIETQRDSVVKIRRILVHTPEEAESVIQALKGGEDFVTLAARAALDSTYTESKYLLKEEFDPPVLQEKVFPLAPGGISEPVFFAEQYGVYQVVDRKAIEMEKVRQLLEPELYKRKVGPKVEEVAARLQREIDFQVNHEALENIAPLIEKGIDNIPVETLQTVLIQFKNGHFDLADYVELIRMHNLGFGGDVEERVYWFNNQVVIPHVLMLQGAIAQGIDREADFVEWFGRREQGFLLKAMRNEALRDIIVEESEARLYYDKNPDRFKPLEAIAVREILVQTEGEAAYLLDQINQGEDLAELAEQHTLRRRGKEDQGAFHIHPYEKQQFGELIDAARSANVGQLVGPVEVVLKASEVLSPVPGSPEGSYYSIFEILESTIGAGPEPFTKVEKRARAMVHKKKNDKAFYQFLLELRYQYEDQIEIYHDNVEKLARAPRS